MLHIKTVKTALKRSNLLIQFKAHNPYDGCHWCWGYAYINEGEVHFLKMEGDTQWSDDLYNWDTKSYRGSYGISFNAERSCKEGLVEAIESGESCYQYNLDNTKDVNNFIKTCNDHDVVGVSQRLFDKGIVLTTKCPECEQEVSIHEMQSTGYHGDGGIGIILTDFVCGDCYCIGTCNRCGEYYGRDEIREVDNEDLCENCAPECPCCLENQTTNSDGICDDCRDTPEYVAYLQRVADHKALQHTPPLPGIDLEPAKQRFEPSI